jgi:hypothetical protein
MGSLRVSANFLIFSLGWPCRTDRLYMSLFLILTEFLHVCMSTTMKVRQTRPSKSVSQSKLSSSSSSGTSSNSGTGKLTGKKKVDVPSCQKCGTVITDDIKALQCDCCEGSDAWSCIDCLNISADAYNYLMAGSGGNCSLRWFCDSCDKVVMSHDDGKVAMNKRLDDIFDMLQQLLQKQADVDSRLTAIDMSLQDKVNNQVVQHLSERLDAIEARCKSIEQVDITNRSVKQPADGTVQQATSWPSTALIDRNVAELQDRDRRRNNVIFFSVAESCGADPQVRMQDDLTTLNKIVLEQMHIAVDLSNPIRFGPRPTGDAKPRPLRISVNSEAEKWQILKATKNLPKPQLEFELSVLVRHDATGARDRSQPTPTYASS